MEWYHPDFAPALTYYASWAQLADLLKLPPDEPVWGQKRARARAVAARVRHESLTGWRRVMQDVQQAACAQGGVPL